MYQTTAEPCPQQNSSAKLDFCFGNDNLFWPSNKLFQKVVKIIHDDFNEFCHDFRIVIFVCAILDLARIHRASRISKYRIRISKLSKPYGLSGDRDPDMCETNTPYIYIDLHLVNNNILVYNCVTYKLQSYTTVY